MDSVTRLPDTAASSPPAGAPSVDVVVPVHIEQGVLTASIRRLDDYLATALPPTPPRSPGSAAPS